MVTLPNVYTSDIRNLLNWWKEIKDIEMVYQEDIWNLMERLERDLNDIKVCYGYSGDRKVGKVK